MAAFKPIYESFMASILTGHEGHARDLVKSSDSISVDQKLSIYIKGYRSRLEAAIEADFPALHAYLGPQTFQELALSYIESHPSDTLNLDHYALPFATYVETTADDRFAHNLAQAEATLAAVFSEAESVPLTTRDIEVLGTEGFGDLRLRGRSASRLMMFDYPVLDWLALQRAGHSPTAPAAEPCFAYFYRHHHEVHREAISHQAFDLLRFLFGSPNLNQALDLLAEKYRSETDQLSEQVGPWFGEWIAKGFFKKTTL